MDEQIGYFTKELEDGKVTKTVFENDEMRIIAIDHSPAPSCCELCGSKSELRPYGPFRKWICFDCGMKNETITEMNFCSVSNGGGQ